MAKKVSFGVRLRKDHLEKLDNLAKKLDVTRTEIVESVISAYFRADVDHLKRTKELIIDKKKEEL